MKGPRGDNSHIVENTLITMKTSTQEKNALYKNSSFVKGTQTCLNEVTPC